MTNSTTYRGVYRISPKLTAWVARDNHQLTCALNGRHAGPITPMDQDQDQFRGGDGGTLQFHRDQKQRVSGLTLVYQGRRRSGHKLYRNTGPLKPELAHLGGSWRGRADLPGRLVDVRLNLFGAANGELCGFLASPEQALYHIPIQAPRFQDGQLIISSDEIAARFTGWLDDSGNQIVGFLKIRGQHTGLSLTRESNLVFN